MPSQNDNRNSNEKENKLQLVSLGLNHKGGSGKKSSVTTEPKMGLEPVTPLRNRGDIVCTLTRCIHVEESEMS